MSIAQRRVALRCPSAEDLENGVDKWRLPKAGRPVLPELPSSVNGGGFAGAIGYIVATAGYGSYRIPYPMWLAWMTASAPSIPKSQHTVGCRRMVANGMAAVRGSQGVRSKTGAPTFAPVGY